MTRIARVFGVLLLMLCNTAIAAEMRGTGEEAQALVAKAIAAYDAKGPEAFADMMPPSSEFRDRDLYMFVIGPDKRIKMMLSYPMSTGRNFDEILRVIDSLQLTANHGLTTPANWQPGEDVIIAPSISDEDARGRFPQGWRAETSYLRFVPQPDARS